MKHIIRRKVTLFDIKEGKIVRGVNWKTKQKQILRYIKEAMFLMFI